MQFSIIYSFDLPKETYPARYRPTLHGTDLWFQTEDNSEYEYAYLGKETDGIDVDDERECKHCGIIIEWDWQDRNWFDRGNPDEDDERTGEPNTFCWVDPPIVIDGERYVFNDPSVKYQEHEPTYRAGDSYRFGWHEKWCAILNERLFKQFCDDQYLYADDCETMGSIGAPGFGVGWAPAISFNSEDYEAIMVNAYVTPIPDDEDGCEDSEEGWYALRDKIIAEYGGSDNNRLDWYMNEEDAKKEAASYEEQLKELV